MAIKNKIKIWPFWDEITPSIIPYFSKRLSIGKPLYIDFSGSRTLTSSGASIILAKLTKILIEHKNRNWNLYFGDNQQAENFLLKIGATNILKDLINEIDLFLHSNNLGDEIVHSQNLNYTTISLPIYKLNNFDGGREDVESFTEWLIKITAPFLGSNNFRFEIFIKMIKEIAKNACDHTNSRAYFGMDLIRFENSIINILFTFSDLGRGIHETVKKFQIQNGEDWSKKGIVDSYYFAYQPGSTTKDPTLNTLNRGIGMLIIQECARILNFDLCIFDANSMGIIPREITHSQIRDNFFNTGSAVGFNYYGKINLRKA